MASGSATSTNPLSPATAVVLGDSANDSGILQLGDNPAPVNQTVAGLSQRGDGHTTALSAAIPASRPSPSIWPRTRPTMATLGGYSPPTQTTWPWRRAGRRRLTLTGVSTYSGPTTVNAGILEAGVRVGRERQFRLYRQCGGHLAAQRQCGLGGLDCRRRERSRMPTPIPALLTTGNDNTNTTFSGLLRNGTGAGALGLAKTGSGVLTLGGSNTYTGPTTISMGALQLMGQSRPGQPGVGRQRRRLGRVNGGQHGRPRFVAHLGQRTGRRHGAELQHSRHVVAKRADAGGQRSDHDQRHDGDRSWLPPSCPPWARIR